MITLKNNAYNKLLIFKTHLPEDADLGTATFDLVSEMSSRSIELQCFTTEGKNYWIVEQDKAQDLSLLDLSNRLLVVVDGQLIYSEEVIIDELQ